MTERRIRSLLELPEDIQEIKEELRVLNATLGALELQIANLVGVLSDMREMAAPLLGWRVKDEK